MVKNENKTKQQLIQEIADLYKRIAELERSKPLFQKDQELRAEQERETLRRLAQRLTEPLGLKEIARAIAEESRLLFRHDAFNLSYYDESLELSVGLYCEDMPIGATEPIEKEPINISLEMFRKSRAYSGKSTLINRVDEETIGDFIPIGEKDRLSRSLLFAPVQWAGKTLGVMSVQSYSAGRYSERDLQLLETFASQCGGALIRVRAEEQLRLLAHMIEGVSEMITITDLENRFRFVNRAFLEKHGYQREEIIGQSIQMIVSPNNPQAILDEILFETRKGSWKGEIRNLKKDGSEFPVELSTSCIQDDQGNVIGLAGVSLDIAERKQREEEQRARHLRIQRYQSAIVELATHKALISGNYMQAIRAITTTLVGTLEVERGSIWLLSEDHEELCCIDMYEKTSGKHLKNIILCAEDYPRYFIALEAGRGIDAHDAWTDSRTCEFCETYLKPFGITSMLDSPIRVAGKLVGVVCIEHTGNPRIWLEEEIVFSGEIADQVAQAILSRQRKRAEEISESFATLGQRLSAAVTPKEAAQIIGDTANQLFGWDAFFINMYSEETNTAYGVINIDTVGGERKEFPSIYDRPTQPSAMFSRVLKEGAQLILRKDPEKEADPNLIFWGDSSRKCTSLMFVPIRERGKKNIGLLSIQSYISRAYDNNDLKVLQSLADHCSGALERTMTEEKLRLSEQRSAAFASLAHRLNSITTPKEAGMIIAEAAEHLLGLDAFFIDLYNSETETTEHVLNIDLQNGQRTEYPRAYLSKALTPMKRRAVQEGAFLILREPDSKAGEEFSTLKFGDHRRSASLMFVPVRKGDRVVGIISVQSYIYHAYNQEDLTTLQSLADHCGGALERIRTEKVLLEEQTRIKAFSELGRDLSAARTPKDAGKIILSIAKQLIGWDACFLLLYSEGKDWLTSSYNVDLIDGKSDEVLAKHLEGKPSSTGYTGKAIREGKQLILRSEEDTEQIIARPFGDTSRRAASLMYAPARIGNKIVGVISVQSYTYRAYDEEDLITLQALADHCGGALERIQTEEDLAKERIRIAAFSELGRDLSAATTPKEAGRIILGIAKKLIGWDCCFLTHYSAEDDLLSPIYYIDIINEKRTEVTPEYLHSKPEPRDFVRKVLYEGKQLVLREEGDTVVKYGKPFGDTSRLSASLMFAPARKGETVVGIISVQSYSHQAYNEEDLETLQTLADHCGGALERIRTEEILSRERVRIAAFSELGRDLSAATTPKEAGRIILGIAKKLIGWDSCFLTHYSAEEDLLAPVYNVDILDGQSIEVTPEYYQVKPNPGGFTRKVLSEGKQLILREGKDAVPDLSDRFGNISHLSASLMFAPARKGDTVVGIISVQSYTCQAYNEEDLATLQALADHCGGALERIRTEENLAKERARIAAFSELGRDLSGATSAKEAGRIIFEAADRLIGWDSCFLLLYSEEKDYVTPMYAMDLIEGEKVEVSMQHFEGPPDPSGYTYQVLHHGKQLILRPEKIQGDSPGMTFGDTSRPSASLMYVPINKVKSVIGVISIHSYQLNAYTPGDLDFLDSLAQHCSGALERFRAEEERRKLESQVQHAQKLESLGVLAGGIAHDFNNLLMAILGNADLALMGISRVSPACENIKHIQTAGKRAADLCRQMLAYSGRGKFSISKIDLGEVVQEMAHLLEVSTSKKAILRFNFAANLPAIQADTTQIRQIIMNLITNASEAIGDRSGVISISTGVMECDRKYLEETYLDEDLVEGVYVYLEVTDTGCGMDKETREKIFDPFFTTKFTGRGLGMAAVLGIVRGHRGSIKIYSEVGRGTTFKVLFPALDLPAVALVKDSSQEPEWQGSGLVLLVDDEEAIRIVGKHMLESAGFSVIAAADGQEAIDIFREHSQDIVCVLLDLTMPHMDGEETFRELRRIQQDVHVILSSGYSEQEVVDRFVGKGLAGFLQKPYQYSSFIAKLREVLGG